ncbi:MAG TPA: hypothetical protein VI756_04855 [Blastocatellia bacterium]
MRFLKVGLPALLFICLLTATANGQSGRKLPTWSDPQPTPTPTPAEQPKAKEKEPLTRLIVTQYLLMVNRSYYTDVAIESCLARLKASKAATVTHEKDMTRKGAIDRAKQETEAYVVYLEMDSDSSGSMGMGGGNPYRLFLEYFVYVPGTAKVKASGRVYQQNVNANSGPVGVPTSGGADYRLAFVGQEAADRILYSLGLPIPR